MRSQTKEVRCLQSIVGNQTVLLQQQLIQIKRRERARGNCAYRIVSYWGGARSRERWRGSTRGALEEPRAIGQSRRLVTCRGMGNIAFHPGITLRASRVEGGRERSPDTHIILVHIPSIPSPRHASHHHRCASIATICQLHNLLRAATIVFSTTNHGSNEHTRFRQT